MVGGKRWLRNAKNAGAGIENKVSNRAAIATCMSVSVESPVSLARNVKS